MILIKSEDLKKIVKRIFVSYGFSDEDAEIVADHLVLANLRGVDSHGVIRVSVYIEGFEKGYVKPCGNLSILRDEGNIIIADGGNCLGIPVATKATRLLIDRAKKYGVAIVAVSNLGHVSMSAYYTNIIAQEKLIGFASVNAPAIVVPWGGSKPVLGTNPISIAFPTSSRPK